MGDQSDDTPAKELENAKLLGKRIDEALMALQGRVSQGIAIGPDLSLLFAEIVLARVDAELGIEPKRAYRWFDDYELSCDTKEEAEALLTRVVKLLRTFNLRVNVRKSVIEKLPRPSQEEWQVLLARQSHTPFTHPNDMVTFWDAAFSLRAKYPESSVLLYALGLLFKVRKPDAHVGRVAQSGISQALLVEPGTAQKAFSLLTYWSINGYQFDSEVFAHTISQMVARHRDLGVSSDVCWALAFCLEHSLPLDRNAGKVLSACDDDCVALQALDASSRGLLPKGFSTKRLQRLLSTASLDGQHWLLAYEARRQGFLSDFAAAIAANAFFAELLAKDVTFYRKGLPKYALVLQPGGAPEWVVEKWVDFVRGKSDEAEAGPVVKDQEPVLDLIRAGLQKVVSSPGAATVVVGDQLLGVQPQEPATQPAGEPAAKPVPIETAPKHVEPPKVPPAPASAEATELTSYG